MGWEWRVEGKSTIQCVVGFAFFTERNFLSMGRLSPLTAKAKDNT